MTKLTHKVDLTYTQFNMHSANATKAVKTK